MRKVILIGSVLIAAFLGSAARADGLRFSYDSKSVAAGAAIDSGVVSVAAADRVTCVANNTAGGSSRNFVATWYADDGTTVLFTSTTAVTNGTTGVFTIGGDAIAATGFTPLPALPSRYMKFQLSAAGAAAGRVTCFGR